MRILALTHLAPPDPSRDVHGVYRRFRLFVRALAAFGDIEVLHFTAEASTGHAAEKRAAAWAGEAWGVPVRVRLAPINTRPRSLAGALAAPLLLAGRGDFRPYAGPEQRSVVRRLLMEKPGLVFAHRLSMAELLRLSGGTQAPVILDIDDIEHDVRLRAASHAPTIGRRAALLAEIPALFLAERRAVGAAARAFVCSEADRAKLAARGVDADQLRVAPNALDLPEMRPPLCPAPVLLFLGAFGHEPNRRAAERLIGRVWPLVHARAPRAQLLMAGAQPERIAQFRSPPRGVSFTGFVPDLDALYAGARAICCPMDEGGGTRVKLIEAAGRGKPIISTAVGAEGLAFANGRDILLAETDTELAKGALQLLHDDARADNLAAAAFLCATRHYRAENVERGIAKDMASALRTVTADGERERARRPVAETLRAKVPPCI
jgi:glycosyltransferase involved in cell wall biosynthesis